jgi:hypothetical protein
MWLDDECGYDDTEYHEMMWAPNGRKLIITNYGGCSPHHIIIANLNRTANIITAPQITHNSFIYYFIDCALTYFTPLLITMILRISLQRIIAFMTIEPIL